MRSVAIMPPVPTARGLTGWDLSALAYARTYGPLSHQLDDDLLAYLGDRIHGAIVADCGCGPGVVAQKLVSNGVARVFAIDASGRMLRQITRDPRIVPLQATMESLPLDRLRREHAPGGFDLILFKRSLYMERSAALAVLGNAYENLRPGGCIAIIHPEKSLPRYLFGSTPRVGRYTAYHLLNRAVSLIGQFLAVESYARYTRIDLLHLAASVAGMQRVDPIPSRQRAFNLVAIRRPAIDHPPG
jgi:SAM-dependent methyltransferase